MGKVNSHADLMADWEELLSALRSSPDLLPLVQEDLDLLAGSLAAARDLKARQNELAALRQETTQQLHAELGRGKETAIQMRSMVRGKIGPWNERLVQFGVAPLRKRRRVKPPGEDVRSPGDDPREALEVGVESQPAGDPGAPRLRLIGPPPVAKPHAEPAASDRRSVSECFYGALGRLHRSRPRPPSGRPAS